uniref:Enzymatic polyprotein n=1 Tax=Cajanus cajan TaxID=3821 RepID=A0A151UIM9_CAJCA|nr:Enzymatic polyprotein [Cajanus cajan]
MNDIFYNYMDFTIVYLDDVLDFSKSINQHIEHLNKFINFIKENGLVVSAKKIKVFQTTTRFLGYEIFQGTITPIQRSLEFVDKFPNEIKDKTQLQRFLGCVNYVVDFIPNIRIICAPLYSRLPKNPMP